MAESQGHRRPRPARAAVAQEVFRGASDSRSESTDPPGNCFATISWRRSRGAGRPGMTTLLPIAAYPVAKWMPFSKPSAEPGPFPPISTPNRKPATTTRPTSSCWQLPGRCAGRLVHPQQARPQPSRVGCGSEASFAAMSIASRRPRFHSRAAARQSFCPNSRRFWMARGPYASKTSCRRAAGVPAGCRDGRSGSGGRADKPAAQR